MRGFVTTVALAIGLGIVASTPASAASFQVDNTSDVPDAVPGDGTCETPGGACTIRAAVMEANALTGADQIDLPQGAFTLTRTGTPDDESVTDLDITDNLTLAGAGQGQTTIDAAGIDRVFDIADADLVLQDLALTGGVATGTEAEGAGGAVRFLPETSRALTLSSVLIEGNEAATDGGAVFASGALTLEILDGSAIRFNRAGTALQQASGGGVAVRSVTERVTVTIRDSAFAQNQIVGGVGRGGGLAVASLAGLGELSIQDSEFRQNRAGLPESPSMQCIGLGGGVYTQVPAELERVAIDENEAGCALENGNVIGGGGGGLMAGQPGGAVPPVSIRDSSLVGNSTTGEGGGAYVRNAAIVNSAVSDNTAMLGGGGINGSPGPFLMPELGTRIRESEIRGNFVAVPSGAVSLRAVPGGGGVSGASVLADSEVEGNAVFASGYQAFGGGTFSVSQISGSSVEKNLLYVATSGPAGGGGAYGVGLVESSSISANTIVAPAAMATGGGIDAGEMGAPSVSNSTVANNRIVAGIAMGGGIFALTFQGLQLSHSTIAFNEAASPESRGGNVFAAPRGGAAPTARASVIAEGEAVSAENCLAGFESMGFNVEDRAQCGFDASTDLAETDPRLGDLSANGGESRTVPLRNDSPAIDLVTAACPPPAVDQRGVSRPIGAACDAGAFEGSTAAFPAPRVRFRSGPAEGAYTNDPTPTFEFGANDETVTLTCAMDTGPTNPCSGPGKAHTSPNPLEDGAHSLAVTPSDGGVQGATRTRSFFVDTVAPDTEITEAPAGPIRLRRPTIRFSGSADASEFECLLNDGAVSCLDSSFRPNSDLSDGVYVFSVAATDRAGNIDPTPATTQFAIDNRRPETSIVEAPEAFTSNPRPTFRYVADEPGIRFRCGFDGGALFECPESGTTPPADLADGAHWFRVHAIDEAGNEESVAARVDFVVDTLPPQTSLATVPGNPTSDPTPLFTFTSPDPGASFRCALDAPELDPCSGSASHRPAVPLADGPHEFRVAAMDRAGNVDPSAESVVFEVDTSAPVLAISKKPKKRASARRPGFRFKVIDPNLESVVCRIDSRPKAACAHRFRVSHRLSVGRHRFKVTARDSLGHKASLAYRFRVKRRR